MELVAAGVATARGAANRVGVGVDVKGKHVQRRRRHSSSRDHLVAVCHGWCGTPLTRGSPTGARTGDVSHPTTSTGPGPVGEVGE
ncbi:Os04g0344800 [Oryza sativa Japonica Group]|uniref:Os04g0344800 protein n=1 Tax=Oryza sativa subsp. japonica TaxID=39947 RepID=Q0JE14_ORYSJ|nr:Os04g0344800 [Oryza sativa Japonica Group]|eukprot:NP_001052509.1 Os04g0344800 [Oryza sativa Japonica Group]